MRICTDISKCVTNRVKKYSEKVLNKCGIWTYSVNMRPISLPHYLLKLSIYGNIESFILRSMCKSRDMTYQDHFHHSCGSVASESSMIWLRHCGTVEIWISPNARSTLWCGTISRFPAVFCISLNLVFFVKHWQIPKKQVSWVGW